MTLSQRVKKLLGFDAARAKADGTRRFAALGEYANAIVLQVEACRFERNYTAELEAALCEAVEALEELTAILSDRDARKEVDSFSAQSGREALTRLAGVCEGMEER